MSTSSVKVTVDRLKDIEQAFRALADRRVLVGFPQETATRQDSPITNAELGYIHNYGSPEANIPQRQFMEPALEEARERIVQELKAAADAGFDKGATALDQGLHRVGLTAQNAVRNKINSNIPPVLAESTLAARRARNVTRTNTLVDTAKMRNAVTYVIRTRAGRNVAVGK